MKCLSVDDRANKTRKVIGTKGRTSVRDKNQLGGYDWHLTIDGAQYKINCLKDCKENFYL